MTTLYGINLKKLRGKMSAILLLICLFLVPSHNAYSDNVGLAIVATGKYVEFVEPLIASAEQYFCQDHQVTYFVFTDRDFLAGNNTINIHQDKLGWPKDSLMRFKIYYDNRSAFKKQDYVFAIDADALFVDAVGDEIFSDHTAVIHAGFPYSRGTYETNPKSTACILDCEGQYYYTKTFWGGSRTNFIEMCRINMEAVDADLKNNVIAIWHDESHWNRYCSDHHPKLILSPSYFYPEIMNIDYPPKIIGLNKNHAEMRQ